MIFAYIDESGDTGMTRSPSPHFAWGAVMVQSSEWLSYLNAAVAFRKRLHLQYGLPVRAELKAQHLVRGHDSYGNLSPRQRMAVFHEALGFLQTSGLTRAFAVVIDKAKIKTSNDPGWVLDKTITWTIQRLQNWASSTSTQVMMIHDEGNGVTIRKRVRAMRRFHYAPSFFHPGTSLRANATALVEDPVERNSKDTYSVQFADLVAYAALRRVAPNRRAGESLWNSLGRARVREVNELAGGPYGIVLWPKQ